MVLFSCSPDEETPSQNTVQTTTPEPETVVVQYTLTVTASEGGSVTDGGTFDEGTELTVSATPNEGYVFVGWEGSDETGSELTISINSNITLNVVFRALNITEVTNNPTEFNYDTSKDYTGKIVEFYPNAFFASDLSENVINGVNLALKTSADEFGKYGPVEYWVMGTNREAGNVLLNEFCERREALGQWDLAECLSSENDESRGGSMSSYIALGESLVSENRPISSAGHNGGFQWGIHKLTSSYPHSLDNYFDYISYLEQFKVIIHEYFHVVQLASVYNLEFEERESKIMPDGAIWMMEGAAEYMALYTLFKQIEDETLNFDESQRKNYESIKTVMTDNMSLGKTLISESCPEYKLKDIKYGDCQQPVYHIGPWAVAYLLNKVNNQNILVETFYPNLEQLGFEDSFNLTFGYSTAEFYDEFDTFLQLPIEEQLEIIPDI